LIRIATQEDIPRIIELGSRSLEDGPYAGVIHDVPAQAEYCAHEVMDKGRILLGEEDGKVVGLIGFILANHHFSGQKYAAELMWFVEEEHRKGGIAMKLLWEAEKQAKEMGAEDMLFTAPNESVAAIYKRFGYKPLEVTYRKAL
jgi:GNAT superfamily N-acetyltransferase